MSAYGGPGPQDEADAFRRELERIAYHAPRPWSQMASKALAAQGYEPLGDEGSPSTADGDHVVLCLHVPCCRFRPVSRDSNVCRCGALAHQHAALTGQEP